MSMNETIDRCESGTRAPTRLRRLVSFAPSVAVFLSVFLLSACQQKMADQPYFRPLEQTEFFADGRSSRPLEHGTISFNQLPYDNPLTSGLTPEYRRAKATAKVDANQTDIPLGAPNDVKNFVDAFPFKMTETDLRRGMDRYSIYCVPCHGPLGDGNGKIVERGLLKPTSYHPDLEFAKNRKPDDKTLPPGFSRGFGRYRLEVPMTEVPVGYYYEVISKGFGAMADYSAQLPDPADRWRIIAYIRTLELSQSVPPEFQDAAKKAASEAEQKKSGGNHP